MSARYRLDEDAFEALLANAFAVQESGLDRKSLAALVDIQRFSGSAQFDFNEEMQMVADRACKLFNAGGVAIALLEANELVYHAGAGIASKDVGRHVAVVLNLSASQKSGQEILRVENAETDTRIEADICRQFGAMSLLMLPICEKQRLMGVLQVLFDSAHVFNEREVRVYRLMVASLEELMLRHRSATKLRTPNSVEPVHDAEHNTHGGRHSAGRLANPSPMPIGMAGQRCFPDRGSRNVAAHSRKMQSTLSQRYRAVMARERSHLRTALKRTFASRGGWIWSTHLNFGAALSAAVALGVMICFFTVNHPATSTGVSAPPTVRALREIPTGNSPFADLKPSPQRSGPTGVTTELPGFRRVQVSPNEVDYLAEDVTIRRFTMASAQPKIRSGVREVNFGDDVTVRYFADAAVVFQPPTVENEMRHKPQVPVTK